MFCLSMAACATSANGGSETGLVQLSQIKSGEEVAVVKTNMGTFKIRFFPQYAPKAVENFVTHAKDGYYNGVTFHRVIEDFMIQGGDPLGTGAGGESIWGQPFEDEFAKELRHIRGAVSMANSGANTNGSQFFIVTNQNLNAEFRAGYEEAKGQQDEVLGTDQEGKEVLVKEYYPAELLDQYISTGGTPHLDFKHTVFGQVFEGMDVVETISKTETGENDKPVESVIIEDITIEKYK